MNPLAKGSPAVPGSPSSLPNAPSSIPGSPSSIPGSPNAVSFGDLQSGSLSGGFTGVSWEGLVELQGNVEKYTTDMQLVRRLVIEYLAVEMEQWAKDNAPWEDQTGDARAGLTGTAEHDDARMTSTATIAHTVDYGLYLESAFGGRFKIILPTVMRFVQAAGQIEAAIYQQAVGSSIKASI